MKAKMSKSVSSLLFSVIIIATAAELDTAKIDSISGLKGKLNSEEGVCKISQPRNDPKIIVDNREMLPFMGLSHTIAIHQCAAELPNV